MSKIDDSFILKLYNCKIIIIINIWLGSEKTGHNRAGKRMT